MTAKTHDARFMRRVIARVRIRTGEAELAINGATLVRGHIQSKAADTLECGHVVAIARHLLGTPADHVEMRHCQLCEDGVVSPAAVRRTR